MFQAIAWPVRCADKWTFIVCQERASAFCLHSTSCHVAEILCFSDGPTSKEVRNNNKKKLHPERANTSKKTLSAKRKHIRVTQAVYRQARNRKKARTDKTTSMHQTLQPFRVTAIAGSLSLIHTMPAIYVLLSL